MNLPPNESASPRVPPQALEAEQALLGALLQFPGALAQAADGITHVDFYGAGHRAIFSAIERTVAAGDAVDIVSVLGQLEGETVDFGGLKYLNALVCGECSPAGVRTYARLIAEAAARRRAIAWADEITEKAFAGEGAAIDLLEHAATGLVQLRERHKAPGRRVPILDLAQLQAAAGRVKWLCKHVIPADSIGMLFGASGAFKSFVALDLALHIAHGLPWLGRKTAKGAVLYIAAEGGAGLWDRIDAWHRARGLKSADAHLYVVPVALDLTADAWRVVEAAQVRGVAPVAVFVDTLSQTFSGEENSANEVAAYFRELGTRFRALWACACILVHHVGHVATERPRGSSAIRANLDFLLGCHRDEKEMLATLSVLKQKDGELIKDQTFSMQSWQVGTDEDGDKVHSLVARHLINADEMQRAIENEVRAGRPSHKDQFLRLAINGISLDNLRKEFFETCGLEDQDSKRRTFNRIKDWAVDNGFIAIDGTGRVTRLTN